MPPAVQSLDHLVLTVADIDASLAFYRDVLGMAPDPFRVADGGTRWALKFGRQKINLHVAGHEFDPRARVAQPGTADLCFLTDTPLDVWASHLDALGIQAEAGPVPRTGATGRILSIYLRDPDGNLIEVSSPVTG